MYRFILLLLSIFFISQLHGQKKDHRYEGKKTVPFGIVEEIDSKILGEKRVLNIYLPQSYHPDSAKSYPLIYLLDGSAHEDYPHIAGLMQFAHSYNILPPSILVGIANVDRYRDFTFPSQDSIDLKELPQSGGSEKFITFLEQEVQPFIQKNYPASEGKTLIGQSMGGLLATEILLKKPDLFDTYIIVSPSLWWDKHSLVPTLGQYFKSYAGKGKRIYVSVGKEHPVMIELAEKLAAAIRESENKKFELFYKYLPREDHGTILHNAVYEAFRELYKKKEQE
ncbi:MAG: alpha/beta hydrolase-fold protein [Bacteroidota bacterium]